MNAHSPKPDAATPSAPALAPAVPLRARDRIEVKGLTVFARHGVHDEEARLGQRFSIDLSAQLDARPAGRSDRLENALDYGALIETAQEAFAERRLLIEAAAEAVAMACLSAFPRIAALEVTVRKPGAPVAAIFEHASVTILRDRSDLAAPEAGA